MQTATARRFLQWSAAMVADLAAALENESDVTKEKAASLRSAAAGAAHTAALVAQVLRLHNQIPLSSRKTPQCVQCLIL